MERLLPPLQDTPEEPTPKVVPIKLASGEMVNGSLPPIIDIRMPKTATKSALIRWLWVMGYSVKEIYPFLGIKYQMVRNIVTTIPKRAAREDLPPLYVEWLPERDIVDEALDAALDASLLEGRKERVAEHYATLRQDKEDKEDEEDIGGEDE